MPVEPEDLRAVAAVAVAPQRTRVNDEAAAPRLGVVEPEGGRVHRKERQLEHWVGGLEEEQPERHLVGLRVKVGSGLGLG